MNNKWIAAMLVLCTLTGVSIIFSIQVTSPKSVTVIVSADELTSVTKKLDVPIDRWQEGPYGNRDFLQKINALQVKRHLYLRRACQRSSGAGASGGAVGPRGAVYFFSVPSVGVNYCSIPKCATTMMKGFFERASGVNCDGDYQEHACADRHLRTKDFKSPDPWLLVVRNPWVRLVSSYVDKYVVERHRLTETCYSYHGMDRWGVPLNFSQLAECILRDYKLNIPLDQHVAPMHWMCQPCTMNYSYIGTTETLREDFGYLATHVFSRIASPSYYETVFSGGYRRPSEKSNKTLESYTDAYSSLRPDVLEALIELYKPDAIYYGYPERPL